LRASGIRRIALTGGIATGKSHVRARLERDGVPTIDADTLARDAVAPGTAGLKAVVERFGPDILAADGTLNRRALGRLVFADARSRRDLEAIIHPVVREAMERWFASLAPGIHPFAVADIPLLFESGRETEFDAVILTVCAPSTQLRRLLARDQMTEEEARQRIDSQLPAEEKARRATYVIDTDGTLAETDVQVDAVVQRLLSR
jgi:dephospho-CoA kinase